MHACMPPLPLPLALPLPAVPPRRLSLPCALADLDPNSDQYVDGTHLARSGQRVWLECMREAVDELL